MSKYRLEGDISEAARFGTYDVASVTVGAVRFGTRSCFKTLLVTLDSRAGICSL